MKFAVKGVSALIIAGLVMGSTTALPANAGGKKSEERDIIKVIDADLKRIDHALFGWLKKDRKRS